MEVTFSKQNRVEIKDIEDRGGKLVRVQSEFYLLSKVQPEDQARGAIIALRVSDGEIVRFGLELPVHVHEEATLHVRRLDGSF